MHKGKIWKLLTDKSQASGRTIRWVGLMYGETGNVKCAAPSSNGRSMKYMNPTLDKYEQILSMCTLSSPPTYVIPLIRPRSLNLSLKIWRWFDHLRECYRYHLRRFFIVCIRFKIRQTKRLRVWRSSFGHVLNTKSITRIYNANI